MQTGIKAIDKLIDKYGFLVDEGRDEFQQVSIMFGEDPRIQTMKLPYCFYREIASAPLFKRFVLHQLFLPHRKTRFASFLLDEDGQLVEQVYYLRDAKGVKACKKVQEAIAQVYASNHEVMAA